MFFRRLVRLPITSDPCISFQVWKLLEHAVELHDVLVRSRQHQRRALRGAEPLRFYRPGILYVEFVECVCIFVVLVVCTVHFVS